MEGLPVSENLVIQSHKGPYSVHFNEALLQNGNHLLEGSPHFLIDANVARLYHHELSALVLHPHTILVEANEESKSIERVIPVIETLVANRIRRGDKLVAIGGGVLQDITCFIASTLLRGIEWQFVPTTLLAQADSCIGSKSSINLGSAKNILGTFNPPTHIHLCLKFLETLDQKDIHSGVGEILKVHAIEGKRAFDDLATNFDQLFTDAGTMRRAIDSALRIKKKYIELDEFDRGIRNIFNYGHSFGHAIESATHFGVPHGIAVTMGMDMANAISCSRGLTTADNYQRMHGVLRKNYAAYASTTIQVDALLSALMKDKKNTATELVLILPMGEDAKIERVPVVSDDVFREQCIRFLNGVNNESL
jgi:3-dehydroquinate synthase